MKLSNLIGVDTYKEAIKEIELENEAVVDTNQKLHDELKRAQNRIAYLEKQLELYKADDEDKLNILREDVKGLENLYLKRIAEAENMIALAKQDADIAEAKIHRAFAEGRMSAYSELGIWNINAHTRGNILVRDDDGEVYEMIRGKLHDVDDDIDIEAAAVKIDDLLEGVDTE